MRAIHWQIIGLLGLALLLLATALIATQASRAFYGVDHPVNLIFYYHVGVAWVGFAGLLIAAIASGLYLSKGELRWSWLAEATIGVSFAFLTLTLATGMIWGRFIWNSWWEWSDIRLVTALIVWFIYAGYLLYYQQAQSSGGYKKAAVFSMLAFLSVPITVASTRLWQSPFHGTTLGRESVMIHYPAFALVLVGMTLVYVYLVALRWHIRDLDGKLHDFRRRLA
jgi:heme exporter protein C